MQTAEVETIAENSASTVHNSKILYNHVKESSESTQTLVKAVAGMLQPEPYGPICMCALICFVVLWAAGSTHADLLEAVADTNIVCTWLLWLLLRRDQGGD